MEKSITIGDILTEPEIAKAQKIFKEDPANFHRRCVEELIKPNMARINKALAQENDPSYLAYAVEFVLGKS
jgi:hypothetical protein